MKKLIVFLFVLICGYGAGLAKELQEVVYLKNGSVVRGVIIEQIPGESLKIQTADGSIFAYKMADVEKMTKEKNPFAPKQKIGNLTAGYKGFIDFGYTFDLSDYDAAKIEFMTSHGYQFNPYFYLGLGVGLHYYTGTEDISVPLFANVRANMMKGAVVPFVDGRIGYSLGDDVDGFYFSPSLGCRVAVAERAGINLSLGYVMQMADIYYYGFGYLWKIKTKVVSGLSLKIGFDF